MPLGLGNNLIRNGGATNPDGLALDLQFATDKTLTARKGPTPTFSRGSTATFIGSDGLIQSAAINIPRFDHDPVTLACRGLLIEEQRTNAFRHSSNFKNTTSSSYWENISTTTITVDQTTSPDGGVNADLLSTSTTGFDCFVRTGSSWTGSTQYTYSIFVKKGPSNYRYVGLYIGAGASALQFPYFDFNNPTSVQLPTITSGTINSTKVEPYPNGWYRISITFTTASTPVTTFGGVYISSSNGTLQSSNPAGNDCYIWGIQSELSSFPTSYIPTTTIPLTRSADVCSITGANFTSFYNQSEGTLYADYDRSTNQGGGVKFTWMVAALYNPSSPSTYSVLVSTQASDARMTYRNAGTNVYDNIPSLLASNAIIKASYGYKSGNFAGARNGSIISTGTGVIPTVSTFDRIEFGFSNNGNYGPTAIQYLNGHIAAIRYYRKRLSNAKLQALTA